MSRTAESVDLLKCSFCGKSQRQVRKLIAGPGVYICDECIELCNDIIAEELDGSPAGGLDVLPTPHEIFDFLQEYVIGQENAKRALSVAVYNHYKRVRAQRHGEDTGMELTKSNILLLGSTGTGYVGEDVENILLRLIQAADGDVKKAERGIIYIDEIDKISRKGENASITRDVSGEGVQQALQKNYRGHHRLRAAAGRAQTPASGIYRD